MRRVVLACALAATPALLVAAANGLAMVIARLRRPLAG